jgi:branched-chain amino acid transport system ATP-binding protein
MSLLETSGLTVTFGGLNANDSVDISIESGTFVGLIGPNGAGKTTFIDAITGFVPVSKGSITFDGISFAGTPPHSRAQAGLSRTFQQLELFEDLTVRDNLLAAAERPPWWGLLADIVRPGRRSPVSDDVDWALDVLGLSDSAERFPSDLSHGQRKLVGVARALASRPKLVLLDEPAAGLDTTESQVLGTQLRSLLDHDTTVFLIDHDMGLVLNVCDYIYVLDFGAIIAEGTPDEVRSDPRVVAAYLGASAADSELGGTDTVAVGEGETVHD